jgi:hypothetical protein
MAQRTMAIHLMTMAVATAAMFAPATQAASNSEQVIFSGIGVPPVSTAPFGFWIWCQNEQAGPSEGHSRYETDCNGAMYFYALSIVTHVTGEVSEPSEGTYVMDVENSDGTVSCTLQNVPPIQRGKKNTVVAECTVNGAAVSGLRSIDAVVNATGP